MIRPHAVALLLVLAAVSSGCSLAGRTFGTYVDDQTVTAAVKMSLVRQEPRTLTRVNVDTFKSTVYLSGEVATALQKSDAEIAAWQVKGVTQVVNDLTVRTEGVTTVSASPALRSPSPLRDRLPGIARLDSAPPGKGALAYDEADAIVATVYVRPVREVTQGGVDALGPTTRPIDHVSIYSMPAEAGLPEAQVYIVLWHVPAAAAGALR